MRQATFHLDFAAPASYLAFELLPAALQGLSYCVRYRPVLQPVAVASAVQVQVQVELAERAGVRLRIPDPYPFDPAPLLRLAWACMRHGSPNRYVVGTILDAVWSGSAPARATDLPQWLTRVLKPARDPETEEIQAELAGASAATAAVGAITTPNFVVDGTVLMGLDVPGMLARLRQQLARGN